MGDDLDGGRGAGPGPARTAFARGLPQSQPLGHVLGHHVAPDASSDVRGVNALAGDGDRDTSRPCRAQQLDEGYAC